MIRLTHVIKMMPGGRRAVNDVSLSIREKERILVHGDPGSGKSVLMRLIAGMDSPDSGEIRILDKSVREMNHHTISGFRNRHMGIMLKDPCLLSPMTVLENVELPLVIRGIPAARRVQAAKKQIKALGLGHIAHARPDQLSLYEAQAAALARALIGEPSILLLDEVFAGLSPRESEQLAGIIDAAAQFGGLTVILFSASTRCLMHTDRTIELDNGIIREDRS